MKELYSKIQKNQHLTRNSITQIKTTQKSQRSPKKTYKWHRNRWSRLCIVSVVQIKATRRCCYKPIQMANTQNIDTTKTQQGRRAGNSHVLLVETQTATFEGQLAVSHGADRHIVLAKLFKTNVYRSLPTAYTSLSLPRPGRNQDALFFLFFFF